jgi:ABC-2 type transport system ATP-binding protein
VTAVIRTGGLTKRYGRTVAIDNLDVEIPGGTVVGLVGPNGAGKTTLLHLAVGLIGPTAGSIEVLGHSPRRDTTNLLQRVAIVFQKQPLYARLSVSDTLELGRRLNPRWHDGPARERLRRLQIPFEQRFGALSTGQQAQVGLALALGKRPDLLLLDEPVANLDPLARRSFLGELMDAVTETGMSVVLASNSVSDLERICDHLVLLNRGALQLIGRVESLLARHRVVIAPAGVEQRLPPGATIVQETRATRETAMVVRMAEGKLDAIDDLEMRPLTLDELVLAYLAAPSVRTTLDVVESADART